MASAAIKSLSIQSPGQSSTATATIASTASSCPDPAGAALQQQPARPAARTSVHPQETSERLPAPNSYRQKRLTPVMAEYTATAHLYSTIDERDYKERIYQLWQCKDDAWLSVSMITRKAVVMSNSCRLRWCPLCSAGKASRIAEGVTEHLKTHKRPKLLTLTLKHSDEPLDTQIHRLYACFREWRRLKYYKQNIHGGVWFFQLKFIEKTQQWHPHLHCLLDSEYLPHEYIRSTWKNITGDSDIIDIRVIKKISHAAEYVARYATRPARLADLTPQQRVEVFDALHGRRLCGKWGTAQEISWGDNPDFKASDYKPIAKYSNMSSHYHNSEWARVLWESYVSGNPIPMCWDLAQLDSEYEPSRSPAEARPEPPPEQLLMFSIAMAD